MKGPNVHRLRVDVIGHRIDGHANRRVAPVLQAALNAANTIQSATLFNAGLIFFERPRFFELLTLFRELVTDFRGVQESG